MPGGGQRGRTGAAPRGGHSPRSAASAAVGDVPPAPGPPRRCSAFCPEDAMQRSRFRASSSAEKLGKKARASPTPSSRGTEPSPGGSVASPLLALGRPKGSAPHSVPPHRTRPYRNRFGPPTPRTGALCSRPGDTGTRRRGPRSHSQSCRTPDRGRRTVCAALHAEFPWKVSPSSPSPAVPGPRSRSTCSPAE